MAKKKVKTKTKTKPKSKASVKPKIKAKIAKKAAPVQKTAPKTVAKSSTKIKLTPIRDQILIRPDAQEEKTAGGLYIPQTVSEKPYRGTVVAAGKGAYSKKGKFQPTSVKAGDQVWYYKYGGQEVLLSGETFIVIKETDLLGLASN